MKDILIDNEHKPVVSGNDFQVGESTQQHQYLILATMPGEWKEFPEVGAAMKDYINSESINDMLVEVRRQFKADGMVLSYVKYNENKLLTDAAYS